MSASLDDARASRAVRPKRVAFTDAALYTPAGVIVLGAVVWSAVGGDYTFGGRWPWGGSLALGASVAADCIVAGIYLVVLVPAILMVVHKQPVQLRSITLAVYAVVALLDFVGLFAFVYLNVAHLVPGSFGPHSLGRLDAVYVATTTLTTVGSGTLQPASEAARAAVTIESALGLLLVIGALGVLVSRLADARHNLSAKR